MSDEKKPLNLDPIKARESAATSGPWEVSFGQNDDLPKYAYADTVTGDRVSLNTSVSDALFIAHAREDVPALVVEVEALRARLIDAQQDPFTDWKVVAKYAEEEAETKWAAQVESLRAERCVPCTAAIVQEDYLDVRDRNARLEKELRACVVAMGKVPIVCRRDEEPYSICVGCDQKDGDPCEPSCWVRKLEEAQADALAELDAEKKP